MSEEEKDIMENQVETPDVEANAEQDANEAESSTASEEAGNSANGAAKPEPVEEPWHKSERFTKLTERARKAEERMEALQDKYEQLLKNQASMNNLTQRGTGQEINPESRQAAIQLAQVLKDTPEVAEMLGLNRASALQEELDQLRQERSKEAFDSEYDKNLESYSKKFGIDEVELKEQFADFLREHPFFGSKDYQRGMVDAAFKSMLFSHQDELKERETNLKLIKDKKEKKDQGVETSAKGSKSKNVNVEKNINDFLDRRVREEGGEIAFD